MHFKFRIIFCYHPLQLDKSGVLSGDWVSVNVYHIYIYIIERKRMERGDSTLYVFCIENNKLIPYHTHNGSLFYNSRARLLRDMHTNTTRKCIKIGICFNGINLWVNLGSQKRHPCCAEVQTSFSYICWFSWENCTSGVCTSVMILFVTSDGLIYKHRH